MDRYRWGARIYDLISAEPVYRVGRGLAVDLLDLSAGQVVVDLGCGTGLNLPYLQRRIGPDGMVVGVDASRQMLDRAARRARRAGWDNVVLMARDATTLAPAEVVESLGGRRIDAVLATYALSLMPDWPAAWQRMRDLAGPGGRVAIVDMQRPTGRAAALVPLARLACALGGADINAHPWTAVEQDAVEVRSASARGGHLQVRVGQVPD